MLFDGLSYWLAPAASNDLVVNGTSNWLDGPIQGSNCYPILGDAIVFEKQQLAPSNQQRFSCQNLKFSVQLG